MCIFTKIIASITYIVRSVHYNSMNMHHTSFFFQPGPEQQAHPAGREALSLPGGSPLSGSPRQRTPPSPAEYEQCERCVNKWPFSCHGIRALRIYWCRHPNGSCKARNPFLSFLLFFPEPQPRLSFFGDDCQPPAPLRIKGCQGEPMMTSGGGNLISGEVIRNERAPHCGVAKIEDAEKLRQERKGRKK